MRYKMYLVAWTLALTALFYITSHANAADYSIKGGAGIVNNIVTGDAKYFAVRREASIFYGVKHAFEAGGYVDNGGSGRKSALVGKYQWGVVPGSDTGVYAKAFLGPCAISARDVYLGGFAQICTDFGFGVRDGTSFVGANYGHISSAGLASPNKGRDFITMEAGLRF